MTYSILMKQKLEMQKNVQLTYAQIYNTYALAAFVHQYTATYVNKVFFFDQFQLFLKILWLLLILKDLFVCQCGFELVKDVRSHWLNEEKFRRNFNAQFAPNLFHIKNRDCRLFF